MNDENTFVAKRQGDGTLVQVLPDGKTKPLAGGTDWERLRAMTDEEVEAAALGDPDAQPVAGEALARMRRVPRVKTLRRALGLTQEEFAARYQIPLGTLRDWEQARAEPDQPARAYLKAIAGDPEGVRRALNSAAPSQP
jgi:putative transcriptional regulator